MCSTPRARRPSSLLLTAPISHGAQLGMALIHLQGEEQKHSVTGHKGRGDAGGSWGRMSPALFPRHGGLSPVPVPSPPGSTRGGVCTQGGSSGCVYSPRRGTVPRGCRVPALAGAGRVKRMERRSSACPDSPPPTNPPSRTEPGRLAPARQPALVQHLRMMLLLEIS